MISRPKYIVASLTHSLNLTSLYTPYVVIKGYRKLRLRRFEWILMEYIVRASFVDIHKVYQNLRRMKTQRDK
jgi:hypothetical protein